MTNDPLCANCGHSIIFHSETHCNDISNGDCDCNGYVPETDSEDEEE